MEQICKYIKHLRKKQYISDIQVKLGFFFPDIFKDFVMTNNGGRPLKSYIVSSEGKERHIMTFLSFNPDDRCSMWNLAFSKDNPISDNIPFAIDDFGNSFCFNKLNNRICFVDHETLKEEFIAENFKEFINKLYDSPPVQIK